MFTGIIQSTGVVSSAVDKDGGREFIISAPGFFSTNVLGDSIAMNGTCLTATHLTSDSVTVFAQIETLEKTSLGFWNEDDVINLEQPLRMSDPLGGHLVQGHIDCTTTISRVNDLPDGSREVVFDIPKQISKYIVDRGSICVNGVSLTVASRELKEFRVALIPATLEKTIFGTASVGDAVNLEVDCIARYVEQMLRSAT